MLIYLIAVLISTTAGQIPLSDFYPYGSESGDNRLPSLDDASTQIPIEFDYPFFGSIYRDIHITTNGLLLFGAGTSSFVPIQFPLLQMKCIATYWTDTDPSRGGTVFYRETYDPSLLERISQEIRTRLVKYSSFTSQWALIVTFDRVSAYGCSSSNTTEETCRSLCSRVVTHQAILTSNGINSFAIFNFNKLDYTVGTARCNGYAQIGFNAGDGKRFYVVPSSDTANISTVGLSESNVGLPGKWIFATDGDDIAESCNSRGLLEIIPRRVLYFGGEEVAVIGPCFREQSVLVFFEQKSVWCRIENGIYANCTVPLLYKLGRNNVRLVQNNITFEGFVMSVDADDSIVMESFFEVKIVKDTLSEFTITWSDQTNVNIDVVFKGYQINYYVDGKGAIAYQDNIALNYGAYLNTGRVTLIPLDSSLPSGVTFKTIIREIMVSGIRLGMHLVAFHVIRIEERSAQIATIECVDWYNKQPSELEMKDIINEISLRSSCPPGVTDYRKIMGNFERDASCNPDKKKDCDYYHPGAIGCYRSLNNGGRPAAQCCYGADNTLLLGPPGGGTVDFEEANLPNFLKHLSSDVFPFNFCCKWSSLCNLYYKKRPSIDSRNFRPPSSSNGNGDPHFRTLDGTSYTFNPVGEFIYLKTTDGTDIIQARISQYVDRTGIRKLACYFSGFVVKSLDSDVIQVDLDVLNMLTFRINGQLLALENGYWSFNEITLNYTSNSTVVLHTTSGIDLEIRILSRMLHVIYTLPETFKGKINGLIGDWDGISSNDLKLPDGSFIFVNSSNQDIHYKFGMAWSTTKQTSLFTYPTGLEWSDYQNTNFTPDFSTPSAIAACGGDINCDYDVRATGDINVGLSNVIISNEADNRNRINNAISKICPTQVAVVNGKVKVERDSTGSTVRYTVQCDADFNLIGSSSVACVDGVFQPLAVCQAKSSSYSHHNTCIPFSAILAFAAWWGMIETM